MNGTEYRVRVETDPDGASALHDPAGEPLPGSRKVYEENPITPGGGPAISYEEYCRYYGNPDRHIVGAVIVDKKCPTCGNWDEDAASLWGIDFMDDDKEANAIGGEPLSPEDALKLPGYLGECVRDVLEEAGYKVPRRRRTAVRG